MGPPGGLRLFSTLFFTPAALPGDDGWPKPATAALPQRRFERNSMRSYRPSLWASPVIPGDRRRCPFRALDDRIVVAPTKGQPQKASADQTLAPALKNPGRVSVRSTRGCRHSHFHYAPAELEIRNYGLERQTPTHLFASGGKQVGGRFASEGRMSVESHAHRLAWIKMFHGYGHRARLAIRSGPRRRRVAKQPVRLLSGQTGQRWPSQPVVCAPVDSMGNPLECWPNEGRGNDQCHMLSVIIQTAKSRLAAVDSP